MSIRIPPHPSPLLSHRPLLDAVIYWKILKRWRWCGDGKGRIFSRLIRICFLPHLISSLHSLELDSQQQSMLQCVCESVFCPDNDDDDEKLFRGAWEEGKKFSFNKLTYSINIDGVSRCPLSKAHVCVRSYQLRMNHYDMVTALYSLRIYAHNKLKMNGERMLQQPSSDKNSSEAQRAFFNASFLKQILQKYFIKVP